MASVEDGKNKLKLFCTRCPSKIMECKTGQYVQQDQILPQMHVKHQESTDAEQPQDKLTEWFVVDDMFKFENIGFSYNVGDKRYLACADCEYGPVGWSTSNSKSCYIAVQRIRQLDVPPES